MKLLERQTKTNTAAGIVAQAVVCLLCKCEPEFKPQSQQKGKKKKNSQNNFCMFLTESIFFPDQIIVFIFFLLFIYAYNVWIISPHSPSLTPSTPLLSGRNYFALISNFVGESISNNRKDQEFLLVGIRIAIQGVDSHCFPVHMCYLLS
jgi:hypothetical protein